MSQQKVELLEILGRPIFYMDIPTGGDASQNH